jgi:signal transduction histidine kinase
MKIRAKLALYFTLIVASILILFAVSIYYFSSSYREQQFFTRLKEKATNTAKLLIEIDEVSYDLLKIIDKNTVSLSNKRIVIYNSQSEKIYDDNDTSSNVIMKNYDQVFLEKVRAKKEIRFNEGEKEGLAIQYDGKKDHFVVIASALDIYGLSKLKNLKFILIGGLFVCVIATMLAGWIYSGRMLYPIAQVVWEVDKITGLSLNQRVHEGNGKDEIAHLAVTFNRMLDRIEEAFNLQKSFVSNASHELRTPLTAITGQIEVSLMNKRSPEEYEAVLSSVLEDTRSLNKMTNGLLELTQANMDIAGIKLTNIRMDELLWQVKNDVLRHHPSYKIGFHILNLPEDESKLIMPGSEQLLKTAFSNIIENACKFSPGKEVNVSFSVSDKAIEINVKDHGIGITKEDIQRIFQPFFRGDNAKRYSGHGLGLSLAQKIVQLHNGKLAIDSAINKYTLVSATFPLKHDIQ